MSDELRNLVLRSLIAKGFFPRELPPVFTSADLGTHADDVISEWKQSKVFSIKDAKSFSKVKGKRFRDRYNYTELPEAEPEILTKPKKSYERRNIHITHPVPQTLLVSEMANNWIKIQKWLSRRKFSEDEIRVGEQYERAIKGINFTSHRAKTNFIESSSDWLVKTDITRFYPSIYTHSISWAAYGKERVKRNRKAYDGSLADRLDVLVRSCNRNQTIGVPVGPETSRIIAELLSSRIDCDFLNASPQTSAKRVDRLQDDWTVGAASLAEAETVISLISECYRSYGLEINGSKTTVRHILSSGDEDWKSEIGAFLSHRGGALQGKRLNEFLALSLRLQLGSPNQPVLNYALSVVEGMQIQRADMPNVESFLLKAAAISPISLDRICRMTLNIEHNSGGLSKDRLVRRFVDLAERHLENSAYFEVMWLLFTVRGLKMNFSSKKIMKLAANVQSSAIRLLLLDMDQMGLCGIRAPKSDWESELSIERVNTDWTWLYAYEAVRKNWLAGPRGFLNDKFIRAMHNRDITFYDPKRNVKTTKYTKRLAAVARKRDSFETRLMLLQLRGLYWPRNALADY